MYIDICICIYMYYIYRYLCVATTVAKVVATGFARIDILREKCVCAGVGCVSVSETCMYVCKYVFMYASMCV